MQETHNELEDIQKSSPVDVNMYSNENSAAVGSEPHIANAVPTETKPSNKTLAHINSHKLIIHIKY